MATAIVTDMTNRHSWNVELKHAGRAFGSLSVALIGCAPSSAAKKAFSGSGSVVADIFVDF